jgi:hypothetical protein
LKRLKTFLAVPVLIDRIQTHPTSETPDLVADLTENLVTPFSGLADIGPLFVLQSANPLTAMASKKVR